MASLLLVTVSVLGAEDCSARYPWVEPAVREFAEGAWASARSSTESSEEALEAIKAIRWGQHPPGLEQVQLLVNSSGGVDMVVTRVSTPNQPYKPVGMVQVLQRAVDTHQAELARLLAGKASPLTLLINTEDFPLVYRVLRRKLPSFSMCFALSFIDLPVPDFTFEVYPEARYTNTSFWAIKELVQAKGRMVPWSSRRRRVFMRHFAGVGYRKTLLPVLQAHQDNGTDLHHLGVEADVRDTGFVGSRESEFMWLDHWCNYRYLLHTGGNTYSAALKYKLACGSVVFMFESSWREFYYPALKPGTHYESLPEGQEEELRNKILPKVKEAVGRLEHESFLQAHGPPTTAGAAWKFVDEQLTPDALSCYWLKALTVYSKLYYGASAADIPEFVNFEM